jgi:hypothetical protein
MNEKFLELFFFTYLCFFIFAYGPLQKLRTMFSLMVTLSDAFGIIDACDFKDLSPDASDDELFEPHDIELKEDEDPNSAFLPGDESIIDEEVLSLSLILKMIYL